MVREYRSAAERHVLKYGYYPPKPTLVWNTRGNRPLEVGEIPMDNRYHDVTDPVTGQVYPAHGPVSAPSLLAHQFRNGANRCSCCDDRDFLDLFKFARAIGCCVLKKVPRQNGGKSCVHNTHMVPYVDVPRWRAFQARAFRGLHSEWYSSTVAMREPSSRGRYWPNRPGRPNKGFRPHTTDPIDIVDLAGLMRPHRKSNPY